MSRRTTRRNPPSKRFEKLDIDAPGTAPPARPTGRPAAPLRRFAKLELGDDGAAKVPTPREPSKRFGHIEPDPIGAGTGQPIEPDRKRARKAIPPTPTQFDAFQTMFDHFNRELFAGQLPQVILNFSRHSGALGFFAPRRWLGATPDTTAHEISLNPEYLRTRTPAEVAGTLVHEMVHLWQSEFGSPSRNGYHNAEWAQKMAQVGLIASDTAAPGGKMTGQRMSHYIAPGGVFVASFGRLNGKQFPWQHIAKPSAPATVPRPPTTGRDEDDGDDEPSAPKGKTKVKYTCPICKTNVWGKPGLRVYCIGPDGQEHHTQGTARMVPT